MGALGLRAGLYWATCCHAVVLAAGGQGGSTPGDRCCCMARCMACCSGTFMLSADRLAAILRLPTGILSRALARPGVLSRVWACCHAALAASGLAFRYSMTPCAASAGMPGGILTGTCGQVGHWLRCCDLGLSADPQLQPNVKLRMHLLPQHWSCITMSHWRLLYVHALVYHPPA